MKKILVGIVAIGAALANGPASAGQGEDAQARIDALEKENAAIRREIAVLRENKALRERSASLKASAVAADPIAAASKPAKPDAFGAYAADMPVAYKAPPSEPRGQFRVWGEGGAIWSGGDRIGQDYALGDFTNFILANPLPGRFDLTPKIGWEAATGFDYRFAGSPWHVSGQFRYGEGRSTQSAASAGVSSPAVIALFAGVVVPPVSAFGGSETITAKYREEHWIADLAAGRDVLGSGPAAMQLKFGLRLSEFTGKTTSSDLRNTNVTFAPPLVIAGFPPVGPASFFAATQTDLRNSFLGAGPRIGVEGSVPLAGAWAFDYLGDAAVLFGNQRLVNTTATSSTFTPAILNVAFGPANSTSITTTNQRFATVFNGDIQLGVSYWMTQNVKLSASYRLDAFFGVLNQTFATSAQTTDRYIHGPRVAVTAQF